MSGINNQIVREQKIRGHNRRHKHIERWRLENLDLRFDLVEQYNNDHIDIVVHPWCDISIVNSIIPEPKGKTKRLILNGLINIYHSWKMQLDNMGKEYYLKIWLYEPRFSKSQVVCAIGDRISHYENLFLKSDDFRKLALGNFEYIKIKHENLSWSSYIDEEHLDNNTVGEPELYQTKMDFYKAKKWFTKQLKKPHRTTKIDEKTEKYSFNRGKILVVGEK